MPKRRFESFFLKLKLGLVHRTCSKIPRTRQNNKEMVETENHHRLSKRDLNDHRLSKRDLNDNRCFT